MKKSGAFLKNNAHRLLAMLMAVVLTVTGITVYSSAHTSTGEFPAAETGKYATVRFTNEINVGSKWSGSLKSLFGCQSVQRITLTSKVNNRNVSREAFCIAPGSAIIPDSTYVSSSLGSTRVKPYYKAAVNYYYETASISDNARRTVTQLFVWQIHATNKKLGKNEKLTTVKLTTSSFETLVVGILKDKYNLSNRNARNAYDEAKNMIFTNGEKNAYRNDIGAVKWDTTNSSGQTLLTGEVLPQDVKIKISVTKEVKKADGSTLTNGVKAGCVFRVYTDKKCTKREKDKDGNYVTITIPYTGDGVSNYMQYKYEDLPDYLYLKEYSAPAGSSVSSAVHEVQVKGMKDGEVKTINVKATNAGWHGKARVRKIDSVTRTPLSGAEFKLQEWNAEKQIFEDVSGTAGGPYKSGADGYSQYTPELYYTENNLGQFRFIETVFPENYKNSSKPFPFTISMTDQNLTVEARNDIDDIGQFTVHKYDKDTGELLDGAEFEISYMNESTSQWVSCGMMDKDPVTKGVFYKKNLPLNYNYRVRETTVPQYYWNIGTADTSLGVQAELTSTSPSTTMSIYNEPKKGQIIVNKVDSETKKPLQGATFEVWETDSTGTIPAFGNKESTEGDGKETVIEDADEENTDARLLGVLTTDINGKFVIPNVWQGGYIAIREISAPEGYKITPDESTYFVDDLMTITAKYSFNNTDFTKEITLTNEPVKIPVEVYKVSSSSKRDTLIPLEGATFSIYNASEIPEADWLNFDTSKYTPVAIMTTDANGKAVSKPLYIGKYVMVETGVPKNMLPCENHVFDIEESTGEVYYHEAIDPEFEARIRIVKKDKKTGNTIKLAGTAFKIRNITTGEFIKQTMIVEDKENPDVAASTYETDTFYTNEEGIAEIPEKLPVGTYECVEFTAPTGYNLNEEALKFSVSTDEPYEWDPQTHDPLITVDFADEQTEGKLIIQKKGEAVKGLTDGKFVYEEIPLKDTTFVLKAAQDIYSPDGSGTLLYKEGEVVDKKVTNDEGEVSFDNLPLGKYLYFEKECPKGYTLDTTEYEVELAYIDQNTHKVTVTEKFNNTRQKVDVKVIKKDKETEKTLAGATFGIFANEDIKDREGNIIVGAGELIEEKITDENGVAHFGEEMDYPVTTLILRELKAPAGYATNKEDVIIEGLEASHTSPVIEREYVVYDDITNTSISKVDITTKEEIEGATLKIWYLDESGNEQVVDLWISQLEPHLIKGLEVGREYTLSETIVAEGYVTADDVKFTLLDTGEIQSVVMEDDYTKVEISKSDITTGTPVENAHLAILDLDGNVITSWITSDQPHRIDKLPIGTYILREEMPPEDSGYVTAEEIQFTVEDTGEIQKVDMKDDYTKVKISKLSLVTGEFVVGATLQIIDEEGNVIEEWETEEAVKQFIRIPFGKYRLAEKEAPEGYMIAEPIDFEVVDSPDELHLVMYDDVMRAKISLIKADAANSDIVLKNAEYTIFDEDGDEVAVLVTDEDGYAISNELPIADYTVRETKAPTSYYVSNDVYNVKMSYDDVDWTDNEDEILYDVGVVVDKKIPVTDNPVTGDLGTKWLYLILVGLFLAAAGICGYGAIKLSEDK